MFLNSINYFRGIAIFIIVLGHSYWLAGFEATTDVEKTFEAVATGGTALFVFVSGFMFHHVFYKRTFDYKKFVIREIAAIRTPQCRATMTSGTVDMPTLEAPMT